MLFRYHCFSVNWDKRYVKNELTWPIAPLSLFSFEYHLLVLTPPSPFANLNPNLMLKASTMTHNHRPQLLHHSLHGQGDNDEVVQSGGGGDLGCSYGSIVATRGVKGKVLFLVAIITEFMLKWFLSISKTVIFADGAYQILGRLILELINGAQSWTASLIHTCMSRFGSSKSDAYFFSFFPKYIFMDNSLQSLF